MKLAHTRNAFSLVEVTMAVGIVAFAFLAIIGLLPVGLKSAREAGLRNAVAMTERTLAEALRFATTSDGQHFNFVIGDQTNTFTTDTPVSLPLPDFTAAGTPALHGDGVLAASMEIFPGPDRFSPSRAIIHVAWPSSANRSGGAWQGSEGSAERSIVFMPR